MGLFSWKTSDTNRSIPCEGASRPTFPVLMLDNEGNVWEEESYEGYGIFGGKDFYELLAEMNGKEGRDEGITLFFKEDNEDVLMPVLVESLEGLKPLEVWEACDKPVDCEFQGYFYDDDDCEDEDEWN